MPRSFSSQGFDRPTANPIRSKPPRKLKKVEEAGYLDLALHRRHMELVDLKHIGGRKLTRQESAELTAICHLMDVREEPFYGGTIKKLRLILKARVK